MGGQISFADFGQYSSGVYMCLFPHFFKSFFYLNHSPSEKYKISNNMLPIVNNRKRYRGMLNNSATS